MKKVDEHFMVKYERKRNMTVEEIKVEKEKKFLQRQKERLFEIVDHIDKIDPLLGSKKEEESQQPAEAAAPEDDAGNADQNMTKKVNLYRKRLNRWKNLGVWLVFISVGVTIVSVGVVRYNLIVKDVSKGSGEIRKWVVLGLFFGGINIICQLSACLIMMSATMTMKKLTKKNGFDSSKFHDIRMNNYVSILICTGYVVDYCFDIALTILLLRDVITVDQEDFWAFVNHIFLSVCIFTAYIILLKIFLTYQKQVHETKARKKEQLKRKKARAEKQEAEKKEQQLLSGETGVTPNPEIMSDEPEKPKNLVAKTAETAVDAFKSGFGMVTSAPAVMGEWALKASTTLKSSQMDADDADAEGEGDESEDGEEEKKQHDDDG